MAAEDVQKIVSSSAGPLAEFDRADVPFSIFIVVSVLPTGGASESEGAMAEQMTIEVHEVSRVANGDLVVTFSDGTTVLFHARFLYEMRNHDSNIEVVEPFD